MSRFPWNPIVSLVVVGLAAITIGSFISDPFGIRSWFADRVKADRDTYQSDAAARGLEVEGERGQAVRTETYHTQVIEVRDLTARAETEARSAYDANEPIEAGRADRLRRHDDGLCDARPSVCGPASPDAP